MKELKYHQANVYFIINIIERFGYTPVLISRKKTWTAIIKNYLCQKINSFSPKELMIKADTIIRFLLLLNKRLGFNW